MLRLSPSWIDLIGKDLTSRSAVVELRQVRARKVVHQVACAKTQSSHRRCGWTRLSFGFRVLVDVSECWCRTRPAAVACLDPFGRGIGVSRDSSTDAQSRQLEGGRLAFNSGN